MPEPPDYHQLMEKYKNQIILESATGIVTWDMETKMPPKGIGLRSQQLAMLSGLDHKMMTDPEISTLLNKLTQPKEHDKLTQLQKRNIYLIKKQYDEQTKLPEKLVMDIAKQRALSVDTWKRAKAARNFKMFKPELEKLVNLQKEAAAILKQVKKTSTPYDALIDIFEPKMDAKTITKVFDQLRIGLVALVKKCQDAPKQPDMKILQYKVSIQKQQQLAIALAEAVGYDVTSKQAGGRIDETEHPFTSGYYDDVRITTHYYEKMYPSSIFSVLHEAGHAMYEQNLNKEWMYQPVGTGCSSGFHESQSRFIENIIGRSREFWQYFLPKMKRITGRPLTNLKLDKYVHAINQVEPSKIRVEADEVTYCLHIIIRFQIEQALFADKIKINDLPNVWNQKYKEYLDIKVQNDSEGVMQDTHWASGLYGYFPSYALGNIYSGQELAQLEKDVPDWRTQLSKGDFKPAKEWLTTHIHMQGNLYDPQELLKKATGKTLDTEPYLAYLNDKYSKLYGF